MPALIIDPDGTVREADLPEHGEFAALQEHTGHETPVPYALTKRWLLWAPGLLTGPFPANPKAASLARRFGFEDGCTGKVVVTATAEHGEVINLTSDQVRVLRAMLGTGQVPPQTA